MPKEKEQGKSEMLLRIQETIDRHQAEDLKPAELLKTARNADYHFSNQPYDLNGMAVASSWAVEAAAAWIGLAGLLKSMEILELERQEGEANGAGEGAEGDEL